MDIKAFCTDDKCKSFNSIPEIKHPETIRALYCQRKQLTSLAGLERCINLEELYAYDNALTSITEIASCPKLKTLFLENNKLTSLAGIERCPNLLIIDCSNNLIEDISGIENCKELLHLYCENNPLTCLNGIECCQKLEDFTVNIENLPPEQLNLYGHLIEGYISDAESQSIEPEGHREFPKLSEFAARLIYKAQSDKECPITFEPLNKCKEVYVNLCGHIVSSAGKDLERCPVCRERTLYTRLGL